MGVYIFDGEPCPHCNGTGGDCVNGECWECDGIGILNYRDNCVVCGVPSFQGCDCEEPDAVAVHTQREDGGRGSYE